MMKRGVMQQAVRSAGFTLIEVTLAIVIGVVVLGGSVVLYHQVKTSAGNSKAKEKQLALGTLIEEFDARANRYPTLQELQPLWASKRPEDYNASPWGGALAGTHGIDGNDNIPARSIVGTAPDYVATPSAATDYGRLYYLKTSGSDYLWINDFFLVPGQASASLMRVQSYGLAYVGPNGENWWMVSGRGLTSGTNPTDAEGAVETGP